MPELPDVEVFRRRLAEHGLRNTIEGVHVPDKRPLDVSPSTLRKHLRSHRFSETRRHGKWLLAAIQGDDRWLAMHFGMTGALVPYRDDAAPRHARIILDLQGGAHLAYTSQRLLGEVDLVRDPDALAKDRGLGPDALDLRAGDLQERLARKSGVVKAALMDQSAVAGIGNVYADEILFQARIHPKARVPDLDKDDWKRLDRHTRDVLQRAVRYDADPDKMPDTWLTPHRRTKDADCPRCGTRLRREPVSGRTTIWCPRRV